MKENRNYTGISRKILHWFPENGHGVSYDNKNREFVPAFHYTNRKRGAFSSKTYWFLQYSVGVSSQFSVTYNNLESQVEVSLKSEGLE